MKKIFGLFLALSMLFTLAACGNSNSQATTPSTEPNQSTTDKVENFTDGTGGTTGATQTPTDEPTTTPTDGTTTPSTQSPTTTPPSTKPSTTEPPTTKPPTTEPPATESPTTEPPAKEPPATEPPVTEPIDYATTTTKYSGRWYLQGYSDIYIDIARLGSDEAMNIEATGISLPGDGVTSTSYTLYPTLIDGYDGWYHTIEIPFSAWDEWLTKKQISLNDTYITLGSRTFVRDAGTKDKYTGKFCKAALGTWYLDKNPDVQIVISVIGGNEDDGDLYGIDTQSLDLATLQYTKNDYCTIIAAKTSDWTNLGISVSNNTLTVSNSYGTKIFYREPTYPTEPPETEPPAPTDPTPTDPQPVRVSGVQISKTTLSLKVGDTQQLTATVSPSNADNKNVTWSSSNSSVVQVSTTGKITAKGEGAAVITVTTKDGGYTASCNVTVSVIHVNGVSLNQTALNMTVGKSQQLTATVSPSNADNKNVTWSSSNSSVAQVSSTGKVTAKGKGTATITVTTVDGNYTATCTITVTEPPLTVSISMGIGYYMNSSGSVRGVFAEATASGGSGNYVEYYIKVYYNGNLVAEGAEKEMVVTLANGTYTAEIYVKDSSGNEATASKSFNCQGY